MDPAEAGSAYKETPSKALFVLEEQFGKGCRSPFLYLEAWKIICKDMTLLHRLNSFWGQVFRFAARRNLLTEELVMRLAYLSGYEKDYNESIYQHWQRAMNSILQRIPWKPSANM